MSQIKAACDEFKRISRVLKAFEGVDSILDVLENAEQVERELALAIETNRAAAQTAMAEETEKAKQYVNKAREDAQSSLAVAKREADQIGKTAIADAYAILEQATAQRAVLHEELKQKPVLEMELAALKQAIEVAANELRSVREESERWTGKINAMKSYLAKLQATS